MIIRERTPGEKQAYLQGYIAGIDYGNRVPVETARLVIATQRQHLEKLDEQTAREQGSKSE